MVYIIVGLAIVLWLVVLLYLGVKTMYERLDQKGFKWTIAACVFLVLTFAFMMYGMAEEEKACNEAGGQMIKTGTQTTYVMSGKVMVPMTTDKRDCLKEVSK